MRYIIGALVSILLVVFVACSNDDGVSAEKRRVSTIYTEFVGYKGSPVGAELIAIEEQENWNKDSLYHSLVIGKYFKKYGQTLSKELNQISFEFIGDDNQMLVYTDTRVGRKIVSTYEYKGDSLFVLKDGVEPVFVANRDKDGVSYYRTKSVQRAIVHSIQTPLDTVNLMNDGLSATFKNSLKLGGFDESTNMTIPEDTIMWCNVKYIYR